MKKSIWIAVVLGTLFSSIVVYNQKDITDRAAKRITPVLSAVLSMRAQEVKAKGVDARDEECHVQHVEKACDYLKTLPK